MHRLTYTCSSMGLKIAHLFLSVSMRSIVKHVQIHCLPYIIYIHRFNSSLSQIDMRSQLQDTRICLFRPLFLLQALMLIPLITHIEQLQLVIIRCNKCVSDQKPATFLHKSTLEVMHVPRLVRGRFLKSARLAKLLHR